MDKIIKSVQKQIDKETNTRKEEKEDDIESIITNKTNKENNTNNINQDETISLDIDGNNNPDKEIKVKAAPIFDILKNSLNGLRNGNIYENGNIKNNNELNEKNENVPKKNH